VGSLSGRAHCPYPAGSTSHDQEAAATRDVLPVAFRRTGVRFSGHPVPAQGFRFPHSRPTSRNGWTQTGVSTFHMHETRTEWAPSVPRGRWCSTRPRHAPQPASAASQRPVPDLGRVLHPFPPTFKMTRHQPRVHSRSPARPSPRPWPPEGTRTLRLEPWAPHPAVTRDARQGGDRPPSTSRGSRHHQEPPPP
jgi:hypothetical protein